MGRGCKTCANASCKGWELPCRWCEVGEMWEPKEKSDPKSSPELEEMIRSFFASLVKI